MAKDFSKQFYDSKKWQACRKNYISTRMLIDGGVCEICHKTPGRILHHKIKLSEENINNPDITLNPAHLMYLCHECHDDLHFREDHNMKPAPRFTADGRIIPLPDDER